MAARVVRAQLSASIRACVYNCEKWLFKGRYIGSNDILGLVKVECLLLLYFRLLLCMNTEIKTQQQVEVRH